MTKWKNQIRQKLAPIFREVGRDKSAEIYIPDSENGGEQYLYCDYRDDRIIADDIYGGSRCYSSDTYVMVHLPYECGVGYTDEWGEDYPIEVGRSVEDVVAYLANCFPLSQVMNLTVRFYSPY